MIQRQRTTVVVDRPRTQRAMLGGLMPNTIEVTAGQLTWRGPVTRLEEVADPMRDLVRPFTALADIDDDHLDQAVAALAEDWGYSAYAGTASRGRTCGSNRIWPQWPTTISVNSAARWDTVESCSSN